MKLTNTDLVYFCQNLLGAPYWHNASVIKATKNAYKVNSIRFPEEYSKRDISFYEKSIAEHEIVTDAVGMLKGFAWSNGGKDILANRGNSLVHTYTVGTNGCPDKSINGMFVWATTQNIKWGEIDTLPEVPGLILTNHGRLGVYEGNGYVIEANRELGYVNREPIVEGTWRFWYELPFIDYKETIKIVDKSVAPKKIEIQGIAIAIKNALIRESKTEDSKLLKVVKKDEIINVYNDSDESLLHLSVDGKDGYAYPELFIYIPEKPYIMSTEMPEEYDPELKGCYELTHNASIRNSSKPRSNAYTAFPERTEIELTGGFSGEWAYGYKKYNEKLYVGYINKKYLKKVIKVEV